ncbi:uncharacterized protein IUM83_13194 [Phytophthora cinnamomi]|uniref:uncharacterized protein n=1 Tax=Phytophthora cinnamomi TaxID=4785 RepID=UPI0035596B78|nr:hypothetical protein IUM83_13194 [Phytophthora cinnamomi]
MVDPEPVQHPDEGHLAEKGQIGDEGGLMNDGSDKPGENNGNEEAEDDGDAKEEEEGEDTSGPTMMTKRMKKPPRPPARCLKLRLCSPEIPSATTNMLLPDVDL